MKNTLSQLRGPALGFLLTLPFIVLELWNQPVSRHDFPFMLFGWLWLLSFLFVLLARSIITTLRAGSVTQRPVQFLAALGFLILIGVMWSGLMIDQFPCFLGVPNCD
jgi:hypothetical protein